MFGLFDQFNTDDPTKQARLAQSLALLEAGGPSRVPVSLFQGLGMAGKAGLEAKRQAQEEARRKLMQDMQLEQLTMQRDKTRLDTENATRLGELARSSMTPGNPAEGQVSPNHWSGLGNAWTPEAPKFDRQNFLQGMLGMGGDYTLKAAEALQKPTDELMAVAPGSSVIGKQSGTLRFTAPNKDDKPTSDIQNFEFAKASGFKGSFNDWLLQKAKAGATNVSVNTEKGFLGDLAQGMGKALSTERDNAQAAVSTINTVQRLKDALKSGSVITGPFASERVKLAQLGATMGIAGKDTQETLTKTRSAIQSLAQLELDAAQQMKGQGQITEAERGIIRRAASGDIDSMTTPELQTLANALEKTARGKIKGYQGRVAPLKTMPGAAPIAPFLDVQEPASDGGGKVVNFGDLK